MRKAIGLLLIVVLLFGTLAGCAKQPSSLYTADDEIWTYTRLDPAKTQIAVSRTGNIEVKHLCSEFEARNPDIQIVYLDITGGNNDYKPLVEWVEKGYVPDVLFSAASFFDEELAPKYLVNLSTSPLLSNYEASALQRTAMDNDVYSLPGPSNVNAMMYNKTLFTQYGWEVPATFDEFVVLCDRIVEDTNGEVEPWNPNAKYGGELLTVLEGFTYEELLGGVENRTWYNDFLAGKATFAGHMEPYMEVIETLRDHDLLREEHFGYSATTRGKEFAAGRIAMINANIYYADNDEFSFGYMPFPTTKGAVGYICDSYSCFVAVPKKEHTEREQDAIDRLLAFFSSPEGQTVYINNTLKISNVKNVPLSQSAELNALQPAITAGNMFAVLGFASDRRVVDLQQCAMDLTTGAKTAQECIAEADAAAPEPAEAKAEEPPEVIATVERDMTMWETSCYIADMYRERADADIGLITHNEPYRGNLMRLFAGDVTPGIVTVLKPRSFANDSTLIKASMTGQQILDALNHPVGDDRTPDCVYAFSGLRCTVAPWNKLGEKYLSVKLANGSALEPDKLYTVGMWSGTVAEEYVTDVVGTFDGVWEEHMKAKMQATGTVAPANDGRYELVWDEK